MVSIFSGTLLLEGGIPPPVVLPGGASSGLRCYTGGPSISAGFDEMLVMMLLGGLLDCLR